MKMSNRKRLQELKLFEYKLKSIYNQNKIFKRIYESSNKKDKEKDVEDQIIFLSTGGNRHIFSEIPDDVINYLKSIGSFNEKILDPVNKTISCFRVCRYSGGSSVGVTSFA